MDITCVVDRPKRLLLTGGVGFIGHHTVEHVLKNTDWEIVVMDRLTYAGNQNFLTNIDCWEQEKYRVKFIYHDFRSPISETTTELIGPIDYIIHMGAESHVDRSIEDPLPFAESNVIGTINMLNYAKEVKPEKFIYVSTDEVYGPAFYETFETLQKDGSFKHELHLHKEGEPHKPSNPYSASKSGAEAFCYAYWNTYGVPVIISNTMNNFGERQNREKFVPRVLRAALKGEELTLHCKKVDGEIVDISSRCWLHARNHADGLLFLLKNGVPGEKYNITGEWASVKDIADEISKITGKLILYKFEDFHSFRPGHDMHYGLDGTKMKEMGWTPPFDLDTSLRHVVEWTMAHPEWL
jgi:dTDP-glucose 4,6-dehydratase